MTQVESRHTLTWRRSALLKIYEATGNKQKQNDVKLFSKKRETLIFYYITNVNFFLISALLLTFFVKLRLWSELATDKKGAAFCH